MGGRGAGWARHGREGAAYLESLVLQHALDGRILAGRGQLGLKDDAEGAVSHYLALGVLHLFGLAGQAILHLLADHLCGRRVSWGGVRFMSRGRGVLPPMRRLEKAFGRLCDMVCGGGGKAVEVSGRVCSLPRVRRTQVQQSVRGSRRRKERVRGGRFGRRSGRRGEVAQGLGRCRRMVEAPGRMVLTAGCEVTARVRSGATRADGPGRRDKRSLRHGRRSGALRGGAVRKTLDRTADRAGEVLRGSGADGQARVCVRAGVCGRVCMRK